MMAFKPIISIPSLAVQTSFNDIYWSTILSNTLHTVGMIVLSPFFSESSVSREVESSSNFSRGKLETESRQIIPALRVLEKRYLIGVKAIPVFYLLRSNSS